MPNSSTRPRVGSDFHRHEADLVDDLIGHLPAYVKRTSKTCTIHREVSVGRSVADVVVALMPENLVRIPPTLSVQDSVIVGALRSNGSTRIDLLERLCGMPPMSLRRGIIDRLQNARVVSRGQGGLVSLGRWCRSGMLIAIEAKLTKWLDALEQARAYRQFADQVYVALPADRVQPALKARAMFEHNSVGLLSVNGDIQCKIRAKSLSMHNWRREFVYSRLVRVAARGATSSASD